MVRWPWRKDSTGASADPAVRAGAGGNGQAPPAVGSIRPPTAPGPGGTWQEVLRSGDATATGGGSPFPASTTPPCTWPPGCCGLLPRWRPARVWTTCPTGRVCSWDAATNSSGSTPPSPLPVRPWSKPCTGWAGSARAPWPPTGPPPAPTVTPRSGGSPPTARPRCGRAWPTSPPPCSPSWPEPCRSRRSPSGACSGWPATPAG